MNRSVHAIYCDDVRLELQGKLSLIGVYSDAMMIHQFPAHLMRLCVVVNAQTPASRPFNGFKITAKYNDAVIAELEITREQMAEEMNKERSSPLINAQAQMIFSPLMLDKPGTLDIFFEADDETFQANPLSVMIPPEGTPPFIQ